jgi:alkyl hydroperoxide reductase subunit AhpC
MTLSLGDTAPNFEATTTEGPIRFHDWIGDSGAVMFSPPKDFTPICTTELGYMARIKPEFDRRGVKVIGLCVDSTGDHERWAPRASRPSTQRPRRGGGRVRLTQAGAARAAACLA